MGNPLHEGASVGDLVVRAISCGGERMALIGSHIA